VNKGFMFLVLLAAVGAANAVQPIASVSSSSTFELRGHAVNVDGVPSWPLAAGDDIATGTESATIQLRDGSRVVLQHGSRLRVDSKDNNIELHLLSGSLRMGSVVSPKVSVYAQEKLVKPVGGSLLTVGPTPTAPRQIGVSRIALPKPVSHP
jgi:hypothetical protein